jgi:DNA-binding transcriptional ArsR family regulator
MTRVSVPDPLIEEAALRFALLADPTRLRVLHCVLKQGEATVTDVAAALGIHAPNVSQHLSRLLAAGIVGRRRDGRQVLYSVADPTIGPLCDLVCSSLQRRAETLTTRPGVGQGPHALEESGVGAPGGAAGPQKSRA